ncbi:MAG: hypothetical protein QM610_04990 [Chitinophagaceae bacterium]
MKKTLVILAVSAVGLLTYDTSHAQKTDGRIKQNVLNLTADQQAKMKQIHQSEKEQAKAIKADSSLSADARKKQLRDLHDKFSQQERAILTPEQQAKQDSLRATHHHFGKGKKGGLDRNGFAAHRPHHAPPGLDHMGQQDKPDSLHSDFEHFAKGKKHGGMDRNGFAARRPHHAPPRFDHMGQQDKPDSLNSDFEHFAKARKHGGMDRNGFAARRPHHAPPKLNLTDQQKQDLKALRQTQKDKIDSIKSNTALSEQEKHQQIASVRTEGRKAFQQLLTPEQKAQFSHRPPHRRIPPPQDNG